MEDKTEFMATLARMNDVLGRLQDRTSDFTWFLLFKENINYRAGMTSEDYENELDNFRSLFTVGLRLIEEATDWMFKKLEP